MRFHTIILFFAIMIVSCSSGSPSSAEKTEAGLLKSYSYSESGSVQGSGITYSISRDKNGVMVSVETEKKGLRRHRYAKKCGQDLLFDSIASILDNAGAADWPSRFESEFEVADGTSWNARLEYDSLTVCTGGHNVWPDGGVLGAVNNLIAVSSGYFKKTDSDPGLILVPGTE